MALIWQQAWFRWGGTLLLCLQYSLLRETEWSTWVKPLPVIFWWLIVWFSPKRPAACWLQCSLFAAFLGDIMLDLGPGWLLVATVPFLGSTALLAFALDRRMRFNPGALSWRTELLILIPLVVLATVFHTSLSQQLAHAAGMGAVLMGLSVLLIWRALAAALACESAEYDPRRWLAVFGCCGIVANYVLYSVDLAGYAVPRDLVIQVYYWGQALVAWSFLQSRETTT